MIIKGIPLISVMLIEGIQRWEFVDLASFLFSDLTLDDVVATAPHPTKLGQDTYGLYGMVIPRSRKGPPGHYLSHSHMPFA